MTLFLLAFTACSPDDASVPGAPCLTDTGASDGEEPDSGGGDSGGGDSGTGDSGGGDSGGSDSGAGLVGTDLDPHAVVFTNNPADLADWTESTRLTVVEFGDDVHVEFAGQDGDGRWPDVVPPGWEGPLQYTLGLAEYVDGQWYASAAIQFWYGLEASGGNVALDDQVAVNWYYDGRWGALAGRQPAAGELVGVFVVEGNVRNVTDDSQSPLRARSNIVLVPFPDVRGARWEF